MIQTSKTQDVVMAFFKPLLPEAWRGITTYDPEMGAYRFEWDWIKGDDGRTYELRSGITGDHMRIGCVVRMEEVMKPAMNLYCQAVYVLAHKEGPPVEISEQGKVHLTSLARAMIQGLKA